MYLYHFHISFSSPSNSYCVHPAPFKFMTDFQLLLLHTYIYVWIYMYINTLYKSDQVQLMLLLLNICLRLITYVWITYRELIPKTSCSPSCSCWLPVALHIGVGSGEASPIYICMPARVLLYLLCRQSYFWDFMDSAFLPYLEGTILQQVSWVLALTNSLLLPPLWVILCL